MSLLITPEDYKRENKTPRPKKVKQPTTSKRICVHCKQPIEIRNPSGICDHLYYPQNCEYCKKLPMFKKASEL